MEQKDEYLIHYWQLPEELFVTLNDNFHKHFCETIKRKLNSKYKNCFYKLLNCPKWHAQRLFTQFTRFTTKELEILRKFSEIPEQEVEKKISSIGNHEDGAVIKNPQLPFQLKDLVYIASHLMFDGCFRDKKGCYFYSYEDSLTEYHKKRLAVFGEVPTNFIVSESQLFFSYTLGYICSKVLNIPTFNSTECCLSEKIKELCAEKIFVDEIIKAMIIDEGSIGDKIKIELANKKLIEDLHEVISRHYNLTKIFLRQRKGIYFKQNPQWTHDCKVFGINFSSTSFKHLNNSISPLPIEYKQEALNFLYDLQTNNQFHRKHNETKKLIITSLLKQPKAFFELAKELKVRRTTISAHIKKLPFVIKTNERVLRRGGYAKENIFGIHDIKKAQEFLEADTHCSHNNFH